MNDTVIQVIDFRKVYGDFVAVDGISFEVHRGEIFGVRGSGCEIQQKDILN